jgi:cell shape-determining protein MreC
MMNSVYRPPYTLTPAIVNLVAGISETIGHYTVLAEQNLTQRDRLTGKGRRWLDPGKIRQPENQYTGKAAR